MINNGLVTLRSCQKNIAELYSFIWCGTALYVFLFKCVFSDRRLASTVDALTPHSKARQLSMQALQKFVIPVQLERLSPSTITPSDAAAIQQQLEQQRQQLQVR